METSSKKAGIILALQALQKNSKLSYKKATSIYNVPHTTLQTRHDSRTSQRDYTSKSKNLINSEENIILKYIL